MCICKRYQMSYIHNVCKHFLWWTVLPGYGDWFRRYGWGKGSFLQFSNELILLLGSIFLDCLWQFLKWRKCPNIYKKFPLDATFKITKELIYLIMVTGTSMNSAWASHGTQFNVNRLAISCCDILFSLSVIKSTALATSVVSLAWAFIPLKIIDFKMPFGRSQSLKDIPSCSMAVILEIWEE